MNNYNLTLILDFTLTENEVKELVLIKRAKEDSKDYFKEFLPELKKLESLHLIIKQVSLYDDDSWTLTLLGEKLLKKYAFDFIIKND